MVQYQIKSIIYICLLVLWKQNICSKTCHSIHAKVSWRSLVKFVQMTSCDIHPAKVIHPWPPYFLAVRVTSNLMHACTQGPPPFWGGLWGAKAHSQEWASSLSRTSRVDCTWSSSLRDHTNLCQSGLRPDSKHALSPSALVTCGD